MAESTTQHFTRNASTQQRPHNDHRKDHSRRIEEDKAKTTEIQSNFTYVNQSGFLKIFMATVAHGIKTMKAAVLLDDGRSNTFCTLNLAQKLQLSTTSHQRLSISHFGSADKTDRCHNISPITLKTIEGHVHLKPIAGPKSVHRNFATDTDKNNCRTSLLWNQSTKEPKSTS